MNEWMNVHVRVCACVCVLLSCNGKMQPLFLLKHRSDDQSGKKIVYIWHFATQIWLWLLVHVWGFHDSHSLASSATSVTVGRARGPLSRREWASTGRMPLITTCSAAPFSGQQRNYLWRHTLYGFYMDECDLSVSHQWPHWSWHLWSLKFVTF